ncbi:MAG: hypothetical protein M5R41_12745 [Bacteroidia bacterium]|nr:hypothetical protein [Bacteroidia bacterium]
MKSFSTVFAGLLFLFTTGIAQGNIQESRPYDLLVAAMRTSSQKECSANLAFFVKPNRSCVKCSIQLELLQNRITEKVSTLCMANVIVCDRLVEARNISKGMSNRSNVTAIPDDGTMLSVYFPDRTRTNVLWWLYIDEAAEMFRSGVISEIDFDDTQLLSLIDSVDRKRREVQPASLLTLAEIPGLEMSQPRLGNTMFDSLFLVYDTSIPTIAVYEIEHGSLLHAVSLDTARIELACVSGESLYKDKNGLHPTVEIGGLVADSAGMIHIFFNAMLQRERDEGGSKVMGVYRAPMHVVYDYIRKRFVSIFRFGDNYSGVESNPSILGSSLYLSGQKYTGATFPIENYDSLFSAFEFNLSDYTLKPVLTSDSVYRNCRLGLNFLNTYSAVSGNSVFAVQTLGSRIYNLSKDKSEAIVTKDYILPEEHLLVNGMCDDASVNILAALMRNPPKTSIDGLFSISDTVLMVIVVDRSYTDGGRKNTFRYHLEFLSAVTLSGIATRYISTSEADGHIRGYCIARMQQLGATKPRLLALYKNRKGLFIRCYDLSW